MTKFVLFFVLAFMFVPIKVKAEYGEKLKLVLRFLWWEKRFTKNEGQMSKNPADIVSLAKQSNNKEKIRKKQRAPKERIKLAKKVIKFVSGKMLKSYARLCRCFFCLGVRVELCFDCRFFLLDAALTGLVYGLVCGLIGSLPQHSGKSNIIVWVVPDFVEQRTQIKTELCANIYPMGVLLVGFLIILRLVYDAFRFYVFSKRVEK